MYDAVIVGAGIAGCCAAVHLARRRHSVLLIEKKSLPADKLCGEFLSPESREVLGRLGLMDAVTGAGAHPIRQLRATGRGNSVFETDLPATALGLSRYRLDHILVDAAREAGVDVIDETAVTTIEGSLDRGFFVEAGDDTFRARVVLGAYGKRSVLDRKLDRPFLQEKSRLVAFKAHYEGVMACHRIELHGFPGGYCGVQRVEGSRVNVCWIGSTERLKEAGGSPSDMLAWSSRKNAHLGERLQGLQRVSDRFLAVSQVHLSPKMPFSQDVCMIGDTAGMIAPMCGDGMAMAMDSAELAVPYVSDFLDDKRTSQSLRNAYASAWRAHFSWRMRLGRWLHNLYLKPMIARAALGLCRGVPQIGEWIIRQTRR